MNIFKAVSLKIASTMAFAIMGAQGRYLGSEVPLGEIVFARGLFALIPIVLFFGWRGQLRGALRTNRVSAHLVRGSFSVIGTFCTFGALARLPIADVTAIAFIAPYKDPVKNKWVLEFGTIACFLIIPFALFIGYFRGIPFWWRLIDCSFGIFGLIPLGICYNKITQLEKVTMQNEISQYSF